MAGSFAGSFLGVRGGARKAAPAAFSGSPEPPGGAHADHETTAANLQEALLRNLDELRRLKPDKLVRRRAEKFLRMGQVEE